MMMLGIFIGMPSIVFSKSLTMDSLLIERIFQYKQTYGKERKAVKSNVYMKWRYNTVKRNFALWLIPHMYGIAKGKRSFITETYGTMSRKANGQVSINKQLTYGTVPHHSKTMPAIQRFLTPDIYGETIYKNQILSPFHPSNKIFYKYSIVRDKQGVVCVKFTPRKGNHTQLVSGQAVVNEENGHLEKVILNGEFDMLKFHTESRMNENADTQFPPQYCKTNIDFKFLGNHITSSFEAFYDCPVSLSDSICKKEDTKALLDSLRPSPLTMQDKYIYDINAKPHQAPDSTQAGNTSPKEAYTLKKLAWEIGDNLVNSLKTEGDRGYIKLSPIINPQYVSYSHSKGVSYKMRLNARYSFNEHRYLDFRPYIGYNFRQRRFYYALPLHFTYNPKRNGHFSIEYTNGNLITHSSLRESISAKSDNNRKTHNRKNLLFSSNRLRMANNIMLIKGVDLETGFIIHQRKAQHPQTMLNNGLSAEYHNFSPVAALRLYPWKKGPVFTIDYERGIKGIYKSRQEYERWEFDVSMKHSFSRMRTFSFRLGGGFYTFKNSSIFLDYTNFRDNNLPEAWNDEWTGNFQLLNSQWYNSSDYYFRSNFSYESPMLLAGRLPYIGRFLEQERIYLSSVLLANMRPYHEIGYGFSTRWFSIGGFASFLHAKFQQAECKFTFELFRRW